MDMALVVRVSRRVAQRSEVQKQTGTASIRSVSVRPAQQIGSGGKRFVFIRLIRCCLYQFGQIPKAHQFEFIESFDIFWTCSV